MYRRLFRAQRGELVRVVVGDLGDIEPAHAVSDLLRPAEGHFQWNLLIQNHPDKQREWTIVQQLIGLRILGEPKLQCRRPFSTLLPLNTLRPTTDCLDTTHDNGANDPVIVARWTRPNWH